MNLVVRFLLELSALAALAYGGALVGDRPLARTAAAVAAPLAMAVAWGIFVSPKAPMRLDDPARAALEVVLFAAAAAALALAGAAALGGALLVAFVVSLALMFPWGQRGQ